MATKPVRDTEALPGDSDLFQSSLIFFAVLVLATTEFAKDSFPTWDALRPSKMIVVYLIFIVQVIPALALTGADWYIARRYTPRIRRNFRRAVFAGAFVLILRQVQLYSGTATDFANELRDVTVLLLILFDLVVLAVVGLIVWKGYRGTVQFFYYMSPIAIAVSAIIVYQVRTDEEVLPLYADEVTTVQDADSPPVFVFVFDGLGYDVMLNEDGQVDEEAFPSAARLAGEGVSFSDATSNQFWSMDSVPMVVGPPIALSDRYNVRLYTEYTEVERQYYGQCGVTITCRGNRWLTESAPLQVAAQLALRTVYQATPEAAESLTSRPMGWLLDGLGWAFPPADDPGWHFFTKRSFDNFLSDVNAEDSYGRLYVVHSMLPHHPNSFDEDGHALSTEPTLWGEAYRDQSRFVDKLLGEFIDKLEREGLYEESTIIVTSDHGPRIITPNESVEPANVTPRVPLLIHAPSLKDHGIVMDVDYQHVDFGETLADVLGLPYPRDGEGVSAFAERRPVRDKTFTIRGVQFVYDQDDDAWHYVPAE